MILILFAVTYMSYPISASTMIEYFKGMGQQGVFIKPPSILLDASIFFFYASGGWGIVLSGLRIVFERSVKKASSDLIGAFFSIFLALLTTNYAADVVTARTTLAFFVIGLGSIVIVTSVVHVVFYRKPQRR